MNILVGTLYCGENEYSECVGSLQKQTHKSWEHFVIQDLPNKVAHDTLYKSFMQRASEFDLFIKLDADMVLEDDTKLEQICRYFEDHQQLEGISICVHDFFTDELLHGLHAYRSSVKWSLDNEKLFVDDFPVSGDQLRIGVRELAPAASHCKNPTDFFAFHFGMHRGLKVVQAKLDVHRQARLAYYLQTIEKVWKNFQRSKDRRLGFAVLGAELAIDGQFGIEDVNYSNMESKQKFEQFQEFDSDEIQEELRKLRRDSSILARKLQISVFRVANAVRNTQDAAWPTLVSCIPKSLRNTMRHFTLRPNQETT